MKKLQFLLLVLLPGLCAFSWEQEAKGPAGAGRTTAQEWYEAGKRCAEDKDYDQALVFFQEAIRQARGESNAGVLRSATLRLGRHFKLMARYREALDAFYEYLKLPDVEEDDRLAARGFVEIASIYNRLGEYERALDNQLEALLRYEAAGDSLGQAQSLYELGSLFFQQQRYPEALDYYTRSYDLCRLLDAPKALYSCLGALGSVHEQLGDLTTSLTYNRQSLELSQTLGYEIGIAYALQNIGTNYLRLEQPERAGNFLREALQLQKKLEDKTGQTSTLKYLGELYLYLEQPQPAIRFLEEGLQLARSAGAKPQTSELYRLLSQVYEKNGNLTDSYFYLKAYNDLRDSLINEQVVQEMSARKSRYDLLKKENEISLLKKENQLLARKKEINRLYIILISTTLLLIILLAGLYYRWYQQQKSFNALLSRQNQKIEQQNRKLASLNRELRQYAYVASHDLREPIRTIGSFIQLLNQRYRDLFDQDAREYMWFITDAVNRLKHMLQDLLSYALIDQEEAAGETVPVTDVIRYVQSVLQPSIREKGIVLEVEEQNLPAVTANRSQLTRLFQNLISNAIKFSDKPQAVVRIGYSELPDHYLFRIEDQGVGIAPEFHEKIFEMFTRFHSRRLYEGTGIGLTACKKIVERHGGRIWVESRPGEGSTFFFQWPRQAGPPSGNAISVTPIH